MTRQASEKLGQRIMDFFAIKIPIIQAPMAGVQDADLAIAACRAGALGSLPCAMLDADKIRSEVVKIRNQTAAPFNLNFFCHKEPGEDQARDRAWRESLSRYYTEFGLDMNQKPAGPQRRPFDEDMCRLVEELRPSVVSFHFGLPNSDFIKRVKAVGARVLSSASTVEEALWLEQNGCDAVIAQGFEAGGHRATFMGSFETSQIGTFSLLPQIVDAVKVPVIAAGGISDARGALASFALGASAVQLGSALLLANEAKTSPLHRTAIRSMKGADTVLTNLFTGRPARGIVNRFIREFGPMSAEVPAFPFAASAVTPIRTAAESQGLSDFSPLWAGQSASFAKEGPAEELIRSLWQDTLANRETIKV